MQKTELPCAECKGKCCTYPAFSPTEFRLLKVMQVKIPEKTFVRPIELVQTYNKGRGTAFVLHLEDGTCPFLTNTGCSIPALKPKVCRDYGVVDSLPCEYLYPKEAQKLQEERVRNSR